MVWTCGEEGWWGLDEEIYIYKNTSRRHMYYAIKHANTH